MSQNTATAALTPVGRVLSASPNGLDSVKKAMDDAAAKVAKISVEVSLSRVQPQLNQALTMQPVSKPVRDGLRKLRQAEERFRTAYTAGDYEQASRRLAAVERSVDALERQKKDYDKAKALRDAVDKAWTAFEPQYNVAVLMKPLTPELAAKVEAFQEADDDYRRSYTAGDYPQAAQNLNALKTAAGALQQLKAAHDPVDQAFRQAADDYQTYSAAWDATPLPDPATLDKHVASAGDVRKLYLEISELNARFQRLWKAKDPTTPTVAATLKAKGAQLQAVLAKYNTERATYAKTPPTVTKNDVDAEWKKYEAQFNTFNNWDPAVDRDLVVPRRSAMVRARKAMDNAEAQNDWTLALNVCKLDMAPAIAELAAVQQTYADAVAYQQALNEPANNKALTDVMPILQKGPPNPGLVPAFQAFNTPNDAAYNLSQAGNYAAAKPELLKAIAAAKLLTAAVQSSNVSTKDYDDYMAEFKAKQIEARVNNLAKYRRFPGISDTLVKLLDDVDAKVKAYSDSSGQAGRDGSWKTAKADLAPCDAAMKALEAREATYNREYAASVQPVKDKATAACKEALNAAKLGARDLKGKANLLKDLCDTYPLSSTLDDAEAEEIKKAKQAIFKTMEPDPAFTAEDTKKNQAILESLKGDPEMLAAKKDWATLDPKARVSALQRAVELQSKVLGVDAPKIKPINAYDPVGREEGQMRSSLGIMHVNVASGKGLPFDNFEQSLNTVLHENTHNFQVLLAERYRNGELDPNDPEYTTAMVLAMNEAPHGYLMPFDVDKNLYERQPRELHAFSRGNALAKAFCGDGNLDIGKEEQGILHPTP